MKTLRVFESFAGYGSQSLALKYAGIPYKSVGFSEIDDKAIKAYNVLHGDVKNYGDITKIEAEKLPNFDLFTYSFPCQALSSLGKQGGMKENSGTTSSLIWETKKIIEAKKPKYLLMENVPGLLNKRNKPEFDKWLKYLENLGYTNKYAVLDASDFYVPQHRERVIMVSTLLKKDRFFDIPLYYNKKKKKPIIKDILEEVVDKKYDLKPTYKSTYKLNMRERKSGRVLKRLGFISSTYGRGNAGAIYDADGLCPTIIAGCGMGGNNVPHIYLGKKNKKDNIRRLTPIECLRLQGVRNSDIYKLVESGLFSDTDLYKLAGNSIAVPVLFKVFKELFK